MGYNLVSIGYQFFDPKVDDDVVSIKVRFKVAVGVGEQRDGRALQKDGSIKRHQQTEV